jgi:hypothetical protein
VSSLLLLLFKHLRLNHVLQFELGADYFVHSNGIVLALKYFNQNLDAFLLTADHVALGSELFHYLSSLRQFVSVDFKKKSFACSICFFIYFVFQVIRDLMNTMVNLQPHAFRDVT